jgi:hypothetical protein
MGVAVIPNPLRELMFSEAMQSEVTQLRERVAGLASERKDKADEDVRVAELKVANLVLSNQVET